MRHTLRLLHISIITDFNILTDLDLKAIHMSKHEISL